MIEIREYRKSDSIEEITRLLNRAYAELAAMGLRYVATWQTPDITAETIADGDCLLALDGERIVGTVTLYGRDDDEVCPYYNRPGLVLFGKFAVDPDRRGEGIGRMLYQAVENLARSKGATEIACDTAEQATHLVGLYERWGFKVVGSVDWSETNYVSVILAKALSVEP